ncbi:UNVERIFIED_CONTAM: hypothetical protein K2H54_036846 [Gekko kuhli]
MTHQRTVLRRATGALSEPYAASVPVSEYHNYKLWVFLSRVKKEEKLGHSQCLAGFDLNKGLFFTCQFHSWLFWKSASGFLQDFNSDFEMGIMQLKFILLKHFRNVQQTGLSLKGICAVQPLECLLA